MRRIGFWLTLLAIVPGSAHADPARSPEEVDQNVQVMIDNTKQLYSTNKPVIRCSQGDPNEIVVCVDRGRDQEVPSTAETDPNSRAARKALDGNIPSAPFVGSIQCRRGADGVCRGNMGWAPPPAYMVDVSALPQAPEGSDADKIAKGEAPAP